MNLVLFRLSYLSNMFISKEILTLRMHMSVVKVTDKGQITLPISIQTSANIKKGDTLLIVEKEGRILLEKTEHLAKEITDDFKDILKFTELSLRKIWNNKEDEIWERYRTK